MMTISTRLLSLALCLAASALPSALAAQTAGDTFAAGGLVCKVLTADDAARSGQVEITGSVAEVGESLEIPATVKQAYGGAEWTFSVTAIGEKAFAESKALKTVRFPAKDESALTVIGPLAFHHCTALQQINLQDTKIEVLEALFTKDLYDEAYFDDLTELVLPETLKEIKPYAMQFLGIRTMTIPSGVTAIGEGILEGNIYLEEFYWRGAQVNSLPINTFLGDDALRKVYYLTVDDIAPDGLTDMHFYMCHKERLTVYVTPSSYAVLTANGYDNGQSIFSTLAADEGWTGIAEASAGKTPALSAGTDADGVFTLHGVRASHPVKGRLYISGGRKYIYR